MILFFKNKKGLYYALEATSKISSETNSKLEWLLEGERAPSEVLEGIFVGPRKEMITPWSTNAVEITGNMGIQGIQRIEEFIPLQPGEQIDPMLQKAYEGLDQEIFDIQHRVHRKHAVLRQQHPYDRRGNPRQRLPLGSHPHDQQLWQKRVPSLRIALLVVPQIFGKRY